MSRNTGNKTNGKAILAAERVNRALELRKAGVTYRVIAEKCGYKNAQRAQEACRKAILRLPRDNAVETRVYEAERLDRLMLTHWERAIKGDLDSGRYIITLMQRRAAMMGLDAPTLINQTGETVLKWEDAEPGPEPEPDDPDVAPPSGPAGG